MASSDAMTGTRQRNGNWRAEWPALTDVLARATITDMKLLPTGSNYVFVIALADDEAGAGVAVYKPRKGEGPLWDYPDGTLYRRERAAYVLSEALGWGIVPPTVIRDGPHEIGMVQLHIDHDPRANFFTFRQERQRDLRRLAFFDMLANNGDRKGGHCLLDADGRIWGIDHGLTFHNEGKLRTVIWDYIGEPLPAHLIGDVERLLQSLQQGGPDTVELGDLLNKKERRALTVRAEQALQAGVFPDTPPWRPVPWPAI